MQTKMVIFTSIYDVNTKNVAGRSGTVQDVVLSQVVYLIDERPAIVESRERFGDWEGALSKGPKVQAVSQLMPSGKADFWLRQSSPTRRQRL